MHPILFEIGPLAVRTYGVFVALAFFICFYFLYKEAARKNFYPEKILDMELAMLISGIMGARALHVAVNVDYYKNHALEIAQLWRGGLAIYGGLFFGIIAGWIFILKKKMPFFKTGDFVAPYIALGQSIGRIGCFLNGCCFGKPPHPAQLYASAALLVIFVGLKLAEKLRLPEGFLFGAYLLLYSAQRFFLDFFRADTPGYAFGLTISQFISVFVFAAGFFLIFKARNRWKQLISG